MTTPAARAMPVTAAVVSAAGGPFELHELTLAPPAAGEVRVRLLASGICHTDLTAQSGGFAMPFPIVLGHEGVGEVEAVGERVSDTRPGDRVVLTFASCGRCRMCSSGHPAYCAHSTELNLRGSRHDGTTSLVWADSGQPVHSHFFGQSSFATAANVSARSVVPVARDIAPELLGGMGCGIQTGAGAVLRALRVRAGSSVGVFGAGAVGLSAVMAACAAGATRVVAVDRSADRLELAEALGATDVVLAGDDPVGRDVRKLAGGGLDYSVEAAGHQSTLNDAVDSLGRLGECAVVGAVPLRTRAEFDWMRFQALGIVVRGVTEGDSLPRAFIPELVELHRQGRFPLERLVTDYPLERIEDAIRDLQRGAAAKAVLVMPEAPTDHRPD